MIIASTGIMWYNYIRIISSSTPPYSIDSSSSSIYRYYSTQTERIFDIYIIDINNAVSLSSSLSNYPRDIYMA